MKQTSISLHVFLNRDNDPVTALIRLSFPRTRSGTNIQGKNIENGHEWKEMKIMATFPVEPGVVVTGFMINENTVPMSAPITAQLRKWPQAASGMRQSVADGCGPARNDERNTGDQRCQK